MTVGSQELHGASYYIYTRMFCMVIQVGLIFCVSLI
jgi:hypothetical protein